jgi:hypothetical protein
MLRSKRSVCYMANRYEKRAGTRVYTALANGFRCMGTSDGEDPYGIVPPEFLERFPEAESIGEALDIAARRPSTTPEEDRRKCPYCLSSQVNEKSEKSSMASRRPETFKCARSGCRRHFDTPADETTIPMTDDRTTPFDWIDSDDLAEPEVRGEGALFAGLPEEKRIELAIRLYKPWTDAGPSYRDLGELFPSSHYWVGERNREWKAGDHRGLVADPSPDVDTAPAARATPDGGARRRRWAAYGAD